MFTVNGNPILENELDVLVELKNQLAINGIKRFEEFKVLQADIQFNCPIHGDGQERKPSCGISTMDKGTVKSGTVHCFSCGYTSTLEEMVSHCFGYDDFGNFGRSWLTKNFLTVSVENRKGLDLNLGREINNKELDKYITEDELDKYRYYHPYMYKRGLTNEIIDKYDIGFDREFNLKEMHLPSLTFPIKDINGKVMYIARRAVNSKVFHLPEGINKPLYGVYELERGIDEVMVCESPFDALTSVKYGRPAIALMGTGSGNQYELLKQLKARKLILALDPDAAGQLGMEKIKKNLKSFKLITSVEIPTGKDINDLEKSDFLSLNEVF